MTITPNGKVEVGAPLQSTGEKVASLAAAAALVTPPSDVINQLECAKCKIMTPVQRSQSKGIISLIILHFSWNTCNFREQSP